MGWYRQYRGQSIGRVLHFLYYYCGLNVAEHATVGPDSVSCFGRKIATYRFLNDQDDIPIFEFLGFDVARDNICDKFRIEESRELYEHNQKTKLLEAILAQSPPEPHQCEKCRSLTLKVSMLEDILSKSISKSKISSVTTESTESDHVNESITNSQPE